MIVYEGEKFGRWTVLESTNYGTSRVRCRCDCGTERVVLIYNLSAKSSQSCGCFNKERMSAVMKTRFGEKAANSRLTKNLVIAIRADFKSGATAPQIVEKYGISLSHAYNIKWARSWRRIDEVVDENRT